MIPPFAEGVYGTAKPIFVKDHLGQLAHVESSFLQVWTIGN
jgi:hypothetical protein